MAWITASDVTNFAPQFSAAGGSTPTSGQVTTQIGNVESEIKRALHAGGYTTSPTDTDDLAYVKLAALNGMAAWVEIIKGTRARPLTDGGAGGAAETYEGTYHRMLRELKGVDAQGRQTGIQILSDSALVESSALFEDGLQSYHTVNDETADNDWMSEAW